MLTGHENRQADGSEVKRIADQVVSRVSRLAAPRGPKAVCDPWPPKAPARSADLALLKQDDTNQKKRDDNVQHDHEVQKEIHGSLKPRPKSLSGKCVILWCGGGDLNPYALRR